MKKLSIVCLAGMLSLAACRNDNSPTTGSYEHQNAEATDSKEGAVHGAHSEKVEETPAESPKTSISIGKDSAGFENKKGTSISTDSTGTKLNTDKTSIEVKH